MGCVCAKGKPTLTIAISKTSKKDDENSILNNALKDENDDENLSNVNNNNSFHNNNSSSSCNNMISNKNKKAREKSNSNIIRVKPKKSGNHSSNFDSSGSEHSVGTPLKKNSNIFLKRNNKTHQIVNNNNSLITALPSFNEFNNVIIEQIPTEINNNTLHINSTNTNNNCVYIDCFSKKKVELSFCKNNLSNRNTNKLSISNSSLSYDHTPSFSEDNNSNSKGIVNVTNITNININPIIVSKNVPSNNTMPTKYSQKKI